MKTSYFSAIIYHTAWHRVTSLQLLPQDLPERDLFIIRIMFELNRAFFEQYFMREVTLWRRKIWIIYYIEIVKSSRKKTTLFSSYLMKSISYHKAEKNSTIEPMKAPQLPHFEPLLYLVPSMGTK